LHAATVPLIQRGGRQEMFPKISSTNCRRAQATREIDLFSFERSWGVFMRGIRAPRQNLSEKGGTRCPQRVGNSIWLCYSPSSSEP
jgi:hypothetical protein